MSITRKGRTLTFTAVNEGVVFDNPIEILGINFQGTGLTAAQRLVLRNTATPGSGDPLVDYVTEAATDNGDLWGGRMPQVVSGGLAIDNNTVAGTWVLTVTYR